MIILNRRSLNYGLNDAKNDRWIDWNKQIRPRRTAGHGPWTGLRFVVKSQNIPSYINIKSGVIVSIRIINCKKLNNKTRKTENISFKNANN